MNLAERKVERSLDEMLLVLSEKTYGVPNLNDPIVNQESPVAETANVITIVDTGKDKTKATGSQGSLSSGS